jgi:tetratricopeptide (TPR) repeat protein
MSDEQQTHPHPATDRPLRSTEMPRGKTDSDPVKIPEYPHIQTGALFIHRALGRIGESLRFAAMVVELDAVGESDGTDRPGDVRDRVAGAIERICRPHDGTWGLLDRRVFGCMIPGGDEAIGRQLAGDLKSELADAGAETVTVGIAAFPCLEYSREQILQNAYKALEHARFFGPDSVAAFDAVSLNISGDRYYDRGDIDRAMDEFGKGLRLDPSNANLHNSLGVCHGIKEDSRNALACFERALACDPDDALALYNAGLANKLLDKPTRALELFVRAAGRPIKRFEVAIQVGRLYLELGRPQEALPYLEKAAAHRPHSPLAYSCLGECYTALDRIDRAIDSYKKALRLNSNDAAALSALGWLYSAEDRNHEIATAFCRHSVDIAPDNGLFRHRLGRLYLGQNRLPEALEQFESAAELGYASEEYIEDIQTRIGKKAG